MKLRHFIITGKAVLALGICALSPSSSHAHDLGGTLGDLQDLFNDCISRGQLFTDVEITKSMLGQTPHYGPSFHNGPPENCYDFTHFRRPLYSRPNNNVFVGFGGPNINGSAWDCQHTTTVYGVMKRFRSGGGYQLVSLGIILGKLENGVCGHSYSAANQSLSTWHIEDTEYGSAPWTSVYGGPTWGSTSKVGNVRILAYSWAHNDPDFGHPGSLCSSDNCYYDSYVTAW